MRQNSGSIAVAEGHAKGFRTTGKLAIQARVEGGVEPG